MPEFVIYLVKSNLSILLFYVAYYIFLRKLTFYDLNRFYLLFGLVFSIIYPAIDFASFFQKNTNILAPVNTWVPDWQQLNHQNTESDFWSLFYYFFFSLVLLFMLRFLSRLLGLYKIHKNSTPAKHAAYAYRKVILKITPFSFWKSIYVNPIPYKHHELEDIFKHEYQHVISLHTLDILLVELISLFCWFNPFIWLTKSAIRENLEFITDRNVISSGTDKKQYQYSLVKVLTQNHSTPIANHFNFKNLKRRILMMNKHRSSRFNIGKYVLAIPLLILFILAFTLTKAYEDKQLSKILEPESLHAKTGFETKTNANTTNSQTIPKLNNEDHSKTTSDHNNKESKTVKKEKSLAVRLKGKKEPLYILDGVEIKPSNFNAITPNDIASISVLKDASAIERYGKKGENGVILITSKGKASLGVKVDTMSQVEIKEGRNFVYNPEKAGDFTFPVKKKQSVVNRKILRTPEVRGRGVIIDDKNNLEKLLPADIRIFLDEKEITREELRSINTNDMRSIEVKKKAKSGHPELWIKTKH